MTPTVCRFDQGLSPRGIRPGELIAGEWRIEAVEEASGIEITHDARGLRVSAPAAARGVLLSAPVPVPVECENVGLQLSLSIRSPDPKALKSALKTVSVLRHNRSGRPTRLVALAGGLARQAGRDRLNVAACLPWPLGPGQCSVELRLDAVKATLTISEVTVEFMVHEVGQPSAPHPRQPDPGAPAESPERRVAVVTWDMSDNPLGRAHVLAGLASRRHKVEVVGSAYARPDEGIWMPLRDSPLPMRSFPGGEMKAFVASAQEMARSVECDVVHVSKARLPGLILGLLIAHRKGCPVILDLDDHELSFCGPEARPLPLAEAEAMEAPEADPSFALPDRSFWTGVGETLISTFEHRTVANAALARRFGGRLIRHARNEGVFRPDPALRALMRQRLGIADTDRVILFAGTPRRHKGLARLVAALHALSDRRLLLVVVGTLRDGPLQRQLDTQSYKRMRLLPDIPFSELPDIPFSELPDMLQIADGVCLLQDETVPASLYQTPAKLSDALSMGIPVAMTPVPTVTELGADRLLTLIHDEAELRGWLRRVADGNDPPEARRGRLDLFRAEFSYAANGARADLVLASALAQPARWHPGWTRLFALINRHFGTDLPEAPPAWARPPAAAPALHRRRPMDLVCFWKQNDSGIYGRRHDMLVKYLRESEEVGTIIQLDAPIRIDQLREQEARAEAAPHHHGQLIAKATARRFLELDDAPGLLRRSFVYARERGASYLGRALPREEDYEAHVRELIKRHCTGQLVSWSWPVAPLQGEVAERLRFDLNVVDLVDDQRTMASTPEQAQRVEDAYRRLLGGADLVFANCAPLREAFAPLSPHPIHLVPNACELYGAGGRRPRDLDDLEGPIIGYVGNLRSRIDIPLLEEVVTRRPDWNFVLVGSAHNTTEILGLRRHRNLRLVGPRVYEEALGYMRSFDVAIMPHLHNAVSERMNPLKLYVYAALGIPVVSTDVPNIEDLRGRIAVASDAADFLAKLDAAVGMRTPGQPHRPLSAEEVAPISWPRRVAEMVALCRTALAG